MNAAVTRNLLAAVVVAMMIVVPNASAADQGYAGVGQFGTAGTGPGEFTSPKDVAVHDASGLVFVADHDNGRVQVFAPSGATAALVADIGGGSLDRPVGVAVDQATGQVYVSDEGAGRIFRFTSSGGSTPTFTLDSAFPSPRAGTAEGRIGSYAASLAVDPATSDLLVADPGNKRISRFASNGDFRSSFSGTDAEGGSFGGPTDIAVDAAGSIFVADATPVPDADPTRRALRFHADGSYDASYASISAPGVVTVDPSTGYVLWGSVNLFGAHIWAYDGTRLVTDRDVPGDPTVGGPGVLTGLAVDGANQHHVYAVADQAFGCCGFVGVQILQAADPPAVAMSAPTAVTATGAHLAGTVNPGGRPTSAHFEASTDGSSWSAVGADQALGSGNGDAAVTADATSLQPNTAYHVRLVATTDSGLVGRSGEQTLTTSAASPTVVTATSGPVTDRSAVLGGKVNPRNAETTYWIEFGTTIEYGQSYPSAHDGVAGSGSAARTVTSTVPGLTPGTTYHYRLVASNAAGVARGSDETVRTLDSTGPVAGLPDGRAYELVSPAEKFGGIVAFPLPAYGPGQGAVAGAAGGGDAVTFYSWNAFDGADHGMNESYLARRTADGWTTKSWSPAPPAANPDANNGRVLVRDFTDDFSTQIIGTYASLHPLDQDDGGTGYGFNDVYVRHGANAPLWQTRSNGDAPDTGQSDSAYASMSADGAHVFFQSKLQLTSNAPAASPASITYERFAGVTRMVPVDAAGPIGACGSVLGSGETVYAGFQGPTVDRAVSDDGSRVFFSVPNSVGVFTGDPACAVPTQLYLRDGDETLRVSESQRAVSDPNGTRPAYFSGASASGGRVYFTSVEALTDSAAVDDATKLYSYDVGERKLSLIAADPSGIVVSRVSADGSHVYFARSLYTGNVTLAVADASGVHDIADGVSQTLLTKGQPPLVSHPEARVTDDGRYFLFASPGSPTSFDAGDTTQLYLYDDASETLRCVSCNTEGRQPIGDARLGSNEVDINNALAFNDARYPYTRNLTDDGRVFFETGDALVAGDSNRASDVYEYRSGAQHLLSDGISRHGAYFFDASADGRDVFIATEASMLSADRGSGDQDLYDARVGGGFPERAKGSPGCTGDACQGPLPTPSDDVGGATGSSLAGGAGDLPPPPRKSASSMTTIRVTAGRTALTVRLKASGAGSVSLHGASLKSLRRSLQAGRTVSITVPLTSRGRALLRARKKLPIKLTIVFTPKDGKKTTRTVTSTFKLR